MFLGIDGFCGMLNTLPFYSEQSQVSTLSINPGEFRSFYVSENINKSYDDINTPWDYDTRMKTNFDKHSLACGSSLFSVQNTDTMILKIREKGALDWQTIFAYPVNSVSDFNITEHYNFAKNNTDYEVLVLSSLNGIINAEESKEVKSEFDRLCLLDNNAIYSTGIEVGAVLYTRNINVQVLEMLNSKYPSVVSYDSTNYDSGTVSGLFSRLDDCMVEEGNSAQSYRKEILDWLVNKQAKVLKDIDGTVKVIQVSDKPAEEIIDDKIPDVKKLTFSFVECGDVNSEDDMYLLGLSDVEPNVY